MQTHTSKQMKKEGNSEKQRGVKQGDPYPQTYLIVYWNKSLGT